MEHNRFSLKRILGIITFALLLYWGLHHPSQITTVITTLFAIISPLIIGGAIAFIVNVPMQLLEHL